MSAARPHGAAARPGQWALAGLVLGLAACASAPPSTEQLRAELQRLALPPLLVARVGPVAIARGEGALVSVSGRVGGTEVARFPYTDACFKAVFATVAELRALGLQAAASPRIWAARLEAELYRIGALDDAEVALQLGRTFEGGELLALGRLAPEEQRYTLAARRVWLAARSALPPAPGAAPPSPRAIRERWFTPEDEPRWPLELEIEIRELALLAEGLAPEGTLRARAALVLTLRHEPGGEVLARIESAHQAQAHGAGLSRPEGGPRYSLTVPAPDPLAEAIALCTREFVAAALPRLRAVAAPPPSSPPAPLSAPPR